MNDSFHNNDDSLFDRLVDGELSSDERRQLVASLDGRADGWRRCALAFLEAQSWRGEMRRMLAEPPQPATIVEPPSRPRRRFPIGSWLATAAALLLAFGLGWQAASPHAGSVGGDANLVAESPNAGVVPNLPGEERRLPDADAVTLVVQDHKGQPHRVQVPLVEGRRLGAQFADAPHWAAPDVRERMAEQGLDLQARRRYAPLFFEQQDRIVPMIVPVDDAVVTPISRPTY